jgi:TPR repeat protein
MIGRLCRRTIVKIAVIAAAVCSGGGVAAEQDDAFKEAMLSYDRQDYATAIPQFRKLADAGNPEAMNILAYMQDLAQEDEDAVKYYRKSAEMGNLGGMWGLGAMMAAGEGTEKNAVEGRKWIQKAAVGGHDLAVGAMAEAYIYGQFGITPEEQKSAEALDWINKAAEIGFLLPLGTLERAYREGNYGLTIDVKRADQIRKRINEIIGVKETKRKRR